MYRQPGDGCYISLYFRPVKFCTINPKASDFVISLNLKGETAEPRGQQEFFDWDAVLFHITVLNPFHGND